MLKYLIILIMVTVFHFLSVMYLDFSKMEGIDLLMWAFIILYIVDRDKFKGRE